MTTAPGVLILRSCLPCLSLHARHAGRQNPYSQCHELCDLVCVSLGLPKTAIKQVRNPRNHAGGVDRAT
jgi:hypothetical protein